VHPAPGNSICIVKPVCTCGAVQTVTKRGVGGSSFVAGYRRIVTPQDTLDVHAMIGESKQQAVSALLADKAGWPTSLKSRYLAACPIAGMGRAVVSL